MTQQLKNREKKICDIQLKQVYLLIICRGIKICISFSAGLAFNQVWVMCGALGTHQYTYSLINRTS